MLFNGQATPWDTGRRQFELRSQFYLFVSSFIAPRLGNNLTGIEDATSPPRRKM
jgi:hypothetical protein